jgi:Ca2+-binding RTX toxin-like protein
MFLRRISPPWEGSEMPIISTDQIGSSSPGLTFSSSPQTYIIRPNVIVAGDIGFDGIVTDELDSTLLSHGFIFSEDMSAVRLEVGADESTIRNYADGTFSGGVYGLWVKSDNVSITNDGDIEGINGGINLAFTSFDVRVTNTGSISSAKADGISSEGGFHNIVNTATGTVTALNNGILVFSADSNVTNSGYILGQSMFFGIGVTAWGDNITVHNNVGGTIEGGLNGVNLFGQGTSLWNAGTVIGDTQDGVYASGQNVVVENVSGGLIQGDFAGIEAIGDDVTIINAGTVSASGSYGILLDFTIPAFASLSLEFEPGPLARVENTGTVFGPVAGIEIQANQNVLVDNLGLIQSTGIGIHAVTNGGQLTLVNNLGTIHGDEAAISAETQLGLFNGKTGVIAGEVVLGATEDEVENFGNIYGDVNLGGGNDLYRARGHGEVTGAVSGGEGHDTLLGAQEDDVLIGDLGNDTIKGGLGEDTITGGAGFDKMNGGADADTFIFTKNTESIGVNPDIIADFSHAQGDIIDLSLIDANTTGAATGNQAFIFDGSSAVVAAGHLSYSVDVNGTATVVGYINNDANADFILRLSNVASLVASDFIL